MTTPLPAGILVYAKDTARLADFYRALLGLVEVHRGEGLVVLRSPGFEMVVHGISAHIATQITISDPPELREEAAMKFFVPVPDLDAAAATALSLGGRVFDEQWQGHDFLVRNGHDPEGNIFQLRQPTTAAA
jgi:predicted enzyme related to lactoylglutathione lyase